ncbi:hypothetical protein RO3G_13246 [Rhizopus delemar RA 99-880]|uniref:Uncharacterized protein n=1 Tax=Rhizopus delemar (strain RA 99-880 / ATCC MYA-4621 / FGSC 9543 / NRRL 43880) TaxID=246409 RepID=I1CJA5_RHIO9|nr:hypothetical protein RO3G_13246 [Rhizopus delemar RA 99-880]|eukprot:EIE88535.1 hypothetical protein RO3G_13246 [Rhizopus delemar RA 99-880]
MSTGLSSTLDLIDLTDKGQASIFEQQEWQEIKSTLMAKYICNKKCYVPEPVATTWKIVTSYLHVLRVCLDIMENNPKILQKKYTSQFTEHDYLVETA